MRAVCSLPARQGRQHATGCNRARQDAALQLFESRAAELELPVARSMQQLKAQIVCRMAHPRYQSDILAAINDRRGPGNSACT
jgi:hypothetical protein